MFIRYKLVILYKNLKFLKKFFKKVCKDRKSLYLCNPFEDIIISKDARSLTILKDKYKQSTENNVTLFLETNESVNFFLWN